MYYCTSLSLGAILGLRLFWHVGLVYSSFLLLVYGWLLYYGFSQFLSVSLIWRPERRAITRPAFRNRIQHRTLEATETQKSNR